MDNDSHPDDSLSTPTKEQPVEGDVSTVPKELISSDNEKESPTKEDQPSLFRRATRGWSHFTSMLQHGILAFVVTLSLRAAKKPKTAILTVVCLSFGLLLTGYSTNFYVELKEEQMFAPLDSPVREQLRYIDQVEYPELVRYLILLVHNDGDNALTYEAVDILFQAVDLARNVEPYDEFCGPEGCDTVGIPRWWGMNSTLFREETKGSDELTRLRLSNNTWYDGTPVPQELFLGHLEKDENGICTSAQSLLTTINVPETGQDGHDAPYFELYVINALHELRNQIQQDPDISLSFEFVAVRSYPDELMRAIQKDIPLVPCVVVIMTLFTCSIFFRNDKIQSRTALGIGSVFTIVMSLMSGYGFAFLIGVPFTSMSQLLPFVGK
jgi:Patched family